MAFAAITNRAPALAAVKPEVTALVATTSLTAIVARPVGRGTSFSYLLSRDRSPPTQGYYRKITTPTAPQT